MDPRIVELLQRLAEVSDDQLSDLEDVLVAELEGVAEARDVDAARSLAEAISNVRTERTQRTELARQREAEIAEIMGKVHASNGETDPSDLPADPDQADPADPADPTDPAEEPATDQAVSASHRPLPKISDLSRGKKTAAASGRNRQAPIAERRSGTTTIVAAADVPGLTAGTEIDGPVTLRKAIVERWNALAGTRGLTGRIPVARINMNFPDDRMLRPGDEEGNAAKLSKLLSPQALLASGGICAPPEGFYEVNTLAVAARPLRDSLAIYGADRGAISFIPSVSLAAVNAAIGVVTAAQDASGVHKPCLSITCGSPQTATVEAISRCLQFGNFNARTHPEFVSHLTDLTLAAHARKAEGELWDSMCDVATSVTAGENLSAWRDLYATVARAAAAFRSRNRMADTAVMRLVAPDWLDDMLSVDLVRQAPGDNTIVGTSRSQFENWLMTIGVRVTWTMESGDPAQVFGGQGVGPLDGWPDAVQLLFYPEGSYLFLDGGTLDLGVVRDSTLNVANDFQLFAETFEGLAFIGPEALCITVDLCPSGLSAGHDDTPINCAGVGVSS